ncbi:hypothetical protein L227DRAFT_28353 [Lentinus tigrinus ALCF2SS1-6]|uniref:Uncharacterized protein n=1 Tax=Lentinus tigrinus ALCF2SS1-6 TaxID=1328759 RepID=A0A5C2SY89_9APHY|nr:hypothetical protein L227DRAFT_28353 [Lentinus tigrinus ALCF2SS1-6]
MISTACPSHPVYHLALPFLWLPPAVGIRNRRHFKLVPGSDSGLARIGLGPECSDSDFLSFLTCRILPAAASDTHHQSRELTSRRRVDCQ